VSWGSPAHRPGVSVQTHNPSGPGQTWRMVALDGTNLTEDLVIATGGWNPAFARVVLIVADEDVALVLVDGNGDGAELELEYWDKGADGWVGGQSNGFGSLGWATGSMNRWDAGSMVCAVGGGAPGETVRIGYDGQVCECAVNQSGLWGFVRKVEHMHFKHQLPELLDEDEIIAEARSKSEASMEIIRDRLRETLQSRRPPTG